MHELWLLDTDELRLRLVDERPMVRWVTVQVIALRRLPLEVDLIDLLSDKSPEVSQAARQGLVRLSRGCDFGPSPQATAAQRTQALAAWRRWLARQDPPPAPSSPGEPKTIVMP